MPSDKKDEFVVTDRRKFTLDGDVRPDAETPREEEEFSASMQPPIVERPASEAPKSAASERSETKAPPAQAETKQTKTSKGPEPAPMPETGYNADEARGAFGGQKIEFVHLLDMLVQTAMMYAGALDSGPERRVDIVGLRQMVDMIGVLEQKTKGNLTEQEATILSNTLFQLRMTYMEIINMIDKQATQGGPGGIGGATK